MQPPPPPPSSLPPKTQTSPPKVQVRTPTLPPRQKSFSTKTDPKKLKKFKKSKKKKVPHVKKESEVAKLSKNFALQTTMVGPSFIAESKTVFAALIWTFIFLCALALTIFNVVHNVTNYMEFPVTTQFGLVYDTLTFPAVTICNVNPIRRSRIDHLPSKSNIRKFLTQLRNDTMKLKRTHVVPDIGNLLSPEGVLWNKSVRASENLSKSVRAKTRSVYPESIISPPGSGLRKQGIGKEEAENFLTDVFKYQFTKLPMAHRISSGHTLSTMLMACTFGAAREKCDHTDFTVQQTGAFGNCYTFNAKQKLVSTKAGRNYGLSLSLYLELDEYAIGLVGGYGIRVGLSSSEKLRNPDLHGLYVAAGTETDIGIRLTDTEWLPEPYGQCINSTDGDKKRNSRILDEKTPCEKRCGHKFIHSECGCYDVNNAPFYEPSIKRSLSTCKTDKELECMTNIQRAKQTIKCDCPKPCHERTFRTQISSGVWPSPTYVEKLIDKVCSRTWHPLCYPLKDSTPERQVQNFVKVNLFYRELNYQTIKQVADYPFSLFLSDLGGAINLCFGLTILSLFELVPFIRLLIAYSLCKMQCVLQLRKWMKCPAKPKPLKLRGLPLRSKPSGDAGKQVQGNRMYQQSELPAYAK